jgi:beta-lactamase class A
MAEVETGAKRLRAGLPKDWIAGDKTGTGVGMGMTDTYVDIAYAGPEGRKPLIIAAYFNPAKASEEISTEAQAVLAEVGRIAADNLPAPSVAALGFRELA